MNYYYYASGWGNSDQMTRRNDNLSSMAASGHIIKSFRCSFCERGFSNAQALGGHMNIHRKDRAKLKDFSDQKLLTLDITKTVGENAPVDPSASDEAVNSKIQDLVSRSIHKPVRSLPLFAVGGDEKNSKKNKLMEFIHGGVDLELRLGHDPRLDAKIKH